MIDLVFSSSHLANSFTGCCSREDLDHGSDHFPIETAFSFSPLVFAFIPKPPWRKANRAALALRARELDFMPNNYTNCEHVHKGVEILVRWIIEAVAQHIPLSKPVSFSVT
jgi:hypothetical protein